MVEVFKKGNSITSFLLETPAHNGKDDMATAHLQSIPAVEKHAKWCGCLRNNLFSLAVSVDVREMTKTVWGFLIMSVTNFGAA